MTLVISAIKVKLESLGTDLKSHHVNSLMQKLLQRYARFTELASIACLDIYSVMNGRRVQ